MKKVIFIDTNIFIKEGLEKHTPDDFLAQLLEQIEEGTTLILPEIIASEVESEIQEKYTGLMMNLFKNFSKQFEAKNFDRTLTKAMEGELDLFLQNKREQFVKFFRELRKHKNVIKIPLTDEIMLHGMKRSTFKYPPAQKSKSNKSAHTRDSDAIAFESLLDGLKSIEEPIDRLVICTNDSDYFLDQDRCLLKPQLEKELGSYASDVLLFKNLVDTLKYEFTKKDEISTKPSSHVSSRTTESAQIIIPGSIIQGSLPSKYWYAQDGKRYIFPTDYLFHSWFPASAPQPVINKISDEELSQIPIGGNVYYRAGMTLIKIESDPKIYAVAQDGVVRWIPDESTISSIYGSRWEERLEIIPDWLFVDYIPGNPIHSIGDFDPIRENALSRLP